MPETTTLACFCWTPLTVKQEVRRSGDQYSTRRHEELEGTMKYDASSGRRRRLARKHKRKIQDGSTPGRRVVFSFVFSCEAGRFAAGQLDALPLSCCSAPLRLRVETGNSLETLRQLRPSVCPTTRRRTPQTERRTHPSPPAPGARRCRPASACCNPRYRSFPQS